MSAKAPVTIVRGHNRIYISDAASLQPTLQMLGLVPTNTNTRDKVLTGAETIQTQLPQVHKQKFSTLFGAVHFSRRHMSPKLHNAILGLSMAASFLRQFIYLEELLDDFHREVLASPDVVAVDDASASADGALTCAADLDDVEGSFSGIDKFASTFSTASPSEDASSIITAGGASLSIVDLSHEHD